MHCKSTPYTKSHHKIVTKSLSPNRTFISAGSLLHLQEIVGGEDEAKLTRLGLEYAPQPHFQSGTPATASAHILEKAKQMTQTQFELRKKIISGLLC